jgi:hypothetical protein
LSDFSIPFIENEHGSSNSTMFGPLGSALIFMVFTAVRTALSRYGAQTNDGMDLFGQMVVCE